jgi:translation initiation factor 2B subunit (eIF-2B alpha/beta/delta family)
MDDLARDIDAVANDRESGASDILRRAIQILQIVDGRPATERLVVARALCRAQPSMASIWNAALAAMADEPPTEKLERFAHRLERAPAALARVGRDVLLAGHDAANALSLVTLSRSRSVERVLRELATKIAVDLACAEGRPALEGRQLAASLAESGVRVTLFSDAAIGEALLRCNAVVVGADAIAANWFMNKVGTRMLAAAADWEGVPVYVIASRDKFCAPALAECIRPREGDTREIWQAPPTGVGVRNPYFERVPIDFVTGLITDAGLMPANDVKAFCESLASAVPAALIAELAKD